MADKPARLVAAADPVELVLARGRFVSRGGDKLDAALRRFEVEVRDRRCLDAGASTGGFTDCLLQQGAESVTAVDVARGKIDPRLRDDRRVTLLERTNVRHLDWSSTGGLGFDVVVADLSFISLELVAGVLARELANPGADLVLLVKPQFEVGKQVASQGRGVVKDPAHRKAAIKRVVSALTSRGASVVGVMASPLLGPAGNAEFFVHAKAHTLSASGGAAAEAAPAESPSEAFSVEEVGEVQEVEEVEEVEEALLRMIDAAIREAPDHVRDRNLPAFDLPGRDEGTDQTRTVLMPEMRGDG